MNYDFVAKRIYSLLKENNVSFKEFYFINEDDFFIFSEKEFNFYLILVGDLEYNNKNNELISNLIYPIENELEIIIYYHLYTEETFNENFQIKELSLKVGKRYVA
jgi:predicted NUDIX family phosphoesterase